MDNFPVTSVAAAEYLLAGTHLNNIRIYSSSLLLCFVRLDKQEKPDEIWVTSTGKVRVVPSTGHAKFLTHDADERALAIYWLSQLFGEDVSEVKICANGVLEIFIGDWVIDIGPDEVNTDEVWSITSDSPDPSHSHEWSVTLDDLGEVTLHTPTTRNNGDGGG